jgi:hypothetical protein
MTVGTGGSFFDNVLSVWDLLDYRFEDIKTRRVKFIAIKV